MTIRFIYSKQETGQIRITLTMWQLKIKTEELYQKQIFISNKRLKSNDRKLQAKKGASFAIKN